MLPHQNKNIANRNRLTNNPKNPNMSAKKVIRKEIERLKNALKKALKPKEAQPQLVLQPIRNQPGRKY